MHRSHLLALSSALALVAASSAARADGTPAPAAPPAAPPAASPASAASSFNASKFVWAGLGLYNISVSIPSVCEDGFCVGGSVSSTNFGITGGGAYGFVQLAPGLMLNGWGDIAIALGSDTYLPINVGAGVTYDKLPVVLFGGLGFELAVPTGGGSTSEGVDIKVMGLSPRAQVMAHLAAQAQFNIAFLSNSLTIWTLTVGAGYSF